MCAKLRFFSYFLILFFMFNSLQADWKAEIVQRHLDERYKIERISDDVVKVENKISKYFKYVNIKDQGQFFKNLSSNMQIFDLMSIDTNQFKSKYQFFDKILVSGALGYPMVLKDLNNNNLLDIVGSYKIEQDLKIANCAIFEIQADSSFQIKHLYSKFDSIVNVLDISDVDKDHLIELNFKKARGQLFLNYESNIKNNYPETLRFSYRMWQESGAIGSETFTDMDNDGITDIIYVGDDTLAPDGQKIYVAEYDSGLHNFVQKYRYSPPEWRVSGFSVGDFDGDGFKEFATGSIDGDVYVFENQRNDAYDLVFSDTISTPNAYLTCATNDIDHNGKIEFFLGGSSYYNGVGGTKVYWFEADGDNHYQKKYTFFLSGTDVLGTTELYSYDVNADGIDDLVFGFGGSVVILIWEEDHFRLHYLDWWENLWQEIQSVNIYDLFNDGKTDLFVSIEDIKNLPRLSTYIYLNNFVTGFGANENHILKDFKLDQNFPNPFNNNTNIRFFIKDYKLISLIIYDINGKEVVKLIDHRNLFAGEHRVVWNGKDKYGKEVSSGVYLYHLKSGQFSQIKKMLLIR